MFFNKVFVAEWWKDHWWLIWLHLQVYVCSWQAFAFYSIVFCGSRLIFRYSSISQCQITQSVRAGWHRTLGGGHYSDLMVEQDFQWVLSTTKEIRHIILRASKGSKNWVCRHLMFILNCLFLFNFILEFLEIGEQPKNWIPGSKWRMQ